MSHNAEAYAPITREYMQYCTQRGATYNTTFADALDRNNKNAALNACATPLTDVDLACIAHALTSLESSHALRVLILEDNNFGAAGVQALMSALQANPNHIRELRLGRNRLGDAVASLIGEALRTHGCGLKVLDLCENEITAVGVQAIAAAVSHKSSSVVELSFHNNKLDDAAAVHLSDALPCATRLKHLHLGYNMLGSTGVAHLARGLSLSRSLSTLDLTANAITYDGASALCEVLSSNRCCLQRLNLRHNTLEDSAIALFANVLRENHSLIQLFLGFMNPRPPTVAHVLEALTHNRTLLLLDIFGWKLAPKPMLTCLSKVQEENLCVAAIITDAYHGLERRVAENNAERDGRGLHPIYVGPDDRDAYVATKSLRRYSRAQSRRSSRAQSRNNSRVRGGAEERSRSGGRARWRARAAAIDEADDATPSARRARRRTVAAAGEASEVDDRHDDNDNDNDSDDRTDDTRHGQPQPQPQRYGRSVSSHSARLRNGNSANSVHTAAPPLSMPAVGEAHDNRIPESDRASLILSSRMSDLHVESAGRSRPSRSRSDLSHVLLNRSYSKPRERAATYKLERLLREVSECVAETQPALVDIVDQLVAALRCAAQQSKGAIGSLEERIERLEERRECCCASNGKPNGLSGVTENDIHSSANLRENSINSARVNRLIKVDGPNGSYMNHDGAMNRAATTRLNGGEGSFLASNRAVGMSKRNGVDESMEEGDGVYIQRGSAMHGATAVTGAASTSMLSSQTRENSSRIPHGSDYSCDWHPGNVSLQRSTSAVLFTPEIEPSPQPDMDPPRRKSISHYI